MTINFHRVFFFTPPDDPWVIWPVTQAFWHGGPFFWVIFWVTFWGHFFGSLFWATFRGHFFGSLFGVTLWNSFCGCAWLWQFKNHKKNCPKKWPRKIDPKKWPKKMTQKMTQKVTQNMTHGSNDPWPEVFGHGGGGVKKKKPWIFSLWAHQDLEIWSWK